MAFAAVSLWFLAIVASKRRDFQDAWILADVALPFVAVLAVFLYAALKESDVRVVVALTSWMTVVVCMIPSLKYLQPYGTTIDAVDHFLLVESLMVAGRVLSEHTYASIPGMHAWLASFGLLAGLTPEQAIQFGLPLTGSLMPLVIYFLCARSGLPSKLTKYTVLSTLLAMVSYYLPNGTAFTSVPLVMILAMILLHAFDRAARWRTRLYATAAVIGIVQLVIWHSTTPLLLPVVLAVGSLTPIAVHVLDPRQGRRLPSLSMLSLALLSGVLFLSYHQLEQDRVHLAVAEEFPGLIAQADIEVSLPAAAPSPVRRFTYMDTLRALLVIRARELLVLALAGTGLVVAIRHRAQLTGASFLYVFFALVLGLFASLLAFSVFAGIPYGRFLLLSVVASPLFVGLALWWLADRISTVRRGWKAIVVGVTTAVIAGSITAWITDVFSYQPLIPSLNAVESHASPDYVVWLSMVNSGYQERMIRFAQSHSGEDVFFAGDLNTNRQFRRYFGIEAASRRRLYAPLFTGEPLDPTMVDAFLLHWPGPAGGFAERVERRSVERLEDLRATPGWGLIYDNGESFVLLVREVGSGPAEASGRAPAE